MADDAPARRPDLTRRAFLTAAAGASAASALAGCAPTSLAAPRAAAAVDDPPTAGAVPVTLRVNELGVRMALGAAPSRIGNIAMSSAGFIRP